MPGHSADMLVDIRPYRDTIVSDSTKGWKTKMKEKLNLEQGRDHMPVYTADADIVILIIRGEPVLQKIDRRQAESILRIINAGKQQRGQ